MKMEKLSIIENNRKRKRKRELLIREAKLYTLKK